MKTAVIYVSIHHGNTEKVAKEIANALKAKLFEARKVKPESLAAFDMIGFGSGIYYSKHHKDILKVINKLPDMKHKKAFIFSTAGVSDRLIEQNIAKHHSATRNALAAKGLDIIDEFSCCGFMTWGYFKLLGARNEGRPNRDDLEKARNFALSLEQKTQTIYNSSSSESNPPSYLNVESIQ